VLISIISAALVLLFSWLPKGGVYPFISRKFWGPGLLWCAGIKLEVRGLEKLDNISNAVFISNHQSHFDIPCITTALPIPVYFIAKKELSRIPIFGWGMWSIGMVFVDRNNRDKALQSMEKAAKQIKKGKFILTFPEGTRSKTGEIQAFKKGSFHLAKNGPLKLIPIVHYGTRKILPSGEKFNPGGKVIVEVGDPISEQEVENRSIQELSRLARNQMIEKFEKLKAEHS
jgi:1-acyl-sn-glycerol-3-phosphate acyltransferase